MICRARSEDGGESVSQLPLKDRAFSTFLDQNQTLELRPENGISPPTFSWNPSWLIQILANPSISFGGGQQGWLAFALRRQRSHARIVSGAPCLNHRIDRSVSLVSIHPLRKPVLRFRDDKPEPKEKARRPPVRRARQLIAINRKCVCGPRRPRQSDWSDE